MNAGKWIYALRWLDMDDRMCAGNWSGDTWGMATQKLLDAKREEAKTWPGAAVQHIVPQRLTAKRLNPAWRRERK